MKGLAFYASGGSPRGLPAGQGTRHAGGGNAPPEPPIRTALIVYLRRAGHSNYISTKFVKKQFECKP